MEFIAEPTRRPLRGEVRVPGDKSISHRAVLFSAIAEGTSTLTGVLDSADVRSTIDAMSALGVRIDVLDAREGRFDLRVHGWGSAGPIDPDTPIDCGNSGTTARLLLGVLSGWEVGAVLTGDASLSRRPMARVTRPLELMGAAFGTAEACTLPVAVRGGGLRGIAYDSPVASAQVKSAVLLAGLSARGRTTVTEPAPSRDHTERLLPAFGVDVGRDEVLRRCWLDGPVTPRATDLAVPGDPSSAAFLVGAAVLVPGSDVTLPGVSVNPTRTGFLRVLERMGAFVRVTDESSTGAEPVGTIHASGGVPLHGTTVTAEEVPALVDEVPLLAVVATHAQGTTRFEGVGELRVKESDRLQALHEALLEFGVDVRAGEDWLEVTGPARIRPCRLDSLGDHRLAMAYTVAALVGTGPVTIDRFESIAVSYPHFVEDLSRLSGA